MLIVINQGLTMKLMLPKALPNAQTELRAYRASLLVMLRATLPALPFGCGAILAHGESSSVRPRPEIH
jgi:hypothetical protein